MIKTVEENNLLLFRQIQQGDESAFEKFFYLFQPSVFRFLYHYTGDRHTAEDLIQDTFIKFWQVRSTLDPYNSPKSLLFKIARNLALNHISRKPKHKQISQQDELLVNICLNPEKEYDLIFLMDDFQRAINVLPERCKAIFILSRYENFCYSEIADTLDISLQTVKNQMNKAISVLKKILAPHFA